MDSDARLESLLRTLEVMGERSRVPPPAASASAQRRSTGPGHAATAGGGGLADLDAIEEMMILGVPL
jgi:hypothetical protein